MITRFVTCTNKEDCRVSCEVPCFVGEGVCPEHHQCQQGPLCRADRIPAPPGGPAQEGATAEGPPGLHNDAGPRQTHLHQPGPHPPLHSGETVIRPFIQERPWICTCMLMGWGRDSLSRAMCVYCVLIDEGRNKLPQGSCGENLEMYRNCLCTNRCDVWSLNFVLKVQWK